MSSLRMNRLGSKRRVVDARADQGQGATPPELVEPGLHGLLLARALEHHVHGPLGDPLGLPGRERLEVGGIEHLVGAQLAGQLLAPVPGLDGGDRPDAAGHQGGDGQRADGTGPDDHHAVAGGHARAGDPVQRHGQRLGQRRMAGGQARRQPQQ